MIWDLKKLSEGALHYILMHLILFFMLPDAISILPVSLSLFCAYEFLIEKKSDKPRKLQGLEQKKNPFLQSARGWTERVTGLTQKEKKYIYV